MNVRYTTSDGRMQFTVEGDGVKGVFTALAQVQEVFEGNKCGQCESADTVLSHREHDGHSFYSKMCLGCGAQLDFGQHKQGGTLFVKRKDQDGNDLGKNGWYHWQRRSQTSSQDRGDYEGF